LKSRKKYLRKFEVKMIISIASGKGGTGKTTVSTNLALSLGSGVQLLDCDVEEPNAHLFMHPVFESTETVTVPVPEIDMGKCTLCGKCSEICQFNAIVVLGETVLPFEELCHSCGGCLEVCPENAITEKGRVLGVIQKGRVNGIEFIHGKLKVGEAMSPPLIRKVLSFADPDRCRIVDGPPGVGCPVIASIGGASAVVIVTEPTVAGKHDMARVAQLAAHFKVPVMLCINKYDINLEVTREIEKYAQKESIACLGRIPFDPIFTEAMIQAQTVVEYSNGSKVNQEIKAIWQKIAKELVL
jgi:MinD superfamily P-loop ATPase